MGILIQPMAACADVIRVKTNGSDDNDGGSWGNAVQTLVKALSLADPNANPKDQIWVAAGTYYPDEGLGRTNNDPSYYFELVNNVGVYGGFAGTESDLNQRDWETNVTVLSGDIDQDDTGEEPDNGNCYNILRSVANASAYTILDGFTVTRGRAYGGTTYTNGGAAFANRGQNTNVTFRNCVFSNHRGYGAGAIGIHNEENATRNAVTFEDCVFLNNKSTGSTDEQNQIFPWGGAVYLSLRSNATFRRCSFIGNQSASRGGAVAHGHSKGTYVNCLFSGNTASERGGAVYLHDDNWNQAEDHGEAGFTNCTFSKNASPAAPAAARFTPTPRRATIPMSSPSSTLSSGTIRPRAGAWRTRSRKKRLMAGLSPSP